MNYFNFDNKPKKFFSPNICLIYDEISRNKLEAKHYMKGCAFKKIPLIEKKCLSEKYKHHAQYVASAEVEDGKIDVDTWSNALNSYIQKNGISTLAIVCHPRMSKDRFKRINTKCIS